MRKILGCFIIIMIMITSQIFAGTIYYVDATNGNDVNPGTELLPWRTIQKAADMIVAGDTVRVKASIYNERVSVTKSGISGSLIQFIANGVVNVQGFNINSNYVKVKGFNCDPTGSKWNTNSTGFYVSGNHCVVEDNHIEDAPFYGIQLKDTTDNCTIKNNHLVRTAMAGIVVNGSNHLIEDNEIEDTRCEIEGIEYDDADGIRFFGSGHTFRGNYIHDITYENNPTQSPHIDGFQTWNHGYCEGQGGNNCTFEKNLIELPVYKSPYAVGTGFQLEGSGGGISNLTIKNNIIKCFRGILMYYDNNGHKIVNNTIVGDLSFDTDNLPVGIRIETIGSHTIENLTIKNNIICEQPWMAIYLSGCSNLDIGFNCTYNSDGSSPMGIPQWHDLWGLNPKFVSLAGGDYHFLSGSPCIDNGAIVYEVNDDYDSNSRPQGEGYDIGAYEYQGSVSPPLSAETNASSTSGYVPLTVDFTGSASGGTASYTYSWNFGDGSSSSDKNPSHTYNSAGTYTVTLTVTDSSSSQATDSLIITATSPASPLSASASASPTSGEAPLTVNFTGSASGGTAPYAYSWNFGDSSSSSSQNPAHTYSSAGNFTVTLTVTDSASSQATASITITAQTQISALAASCTASPTSGDIPLTVNFTGTAAGGISPYAYSWNFGDGASSTTQNPSHTYTQAGTYTVTLTVTDSAASQATTSTEVTASSPVHEVTVPDTPEGPSTGAPGVSYTYTTGGSSCSQGHSVEYYFDWGDGAYSSWSSSTSASHIWSAAGTYAVKVQARCSVNPGVTSLWSEAKTVSLEESPNFQLYISSATDSPASGQGGSTNPDTGTYPYPAGNTAQVTALPTANYRFSKWTGDISGSDSYNSEITFNMDQDKSISALFCTQCGDVNGDLSITPADAQYVFEMFLGIISSATETQKENADVNCDGTAAEPNITPADAQAIFEKFLGISELPGDCSCRSRADASSTAFTQNNRSQTAPLEIQPGTPNIQLTIDDIDARFKREITVPVRINNPFNIKSFGFDLAFDSGTLEFAGIEIGSLLNGFTMVDANEISEGVVRVGGFSSEPILTSSPSVLVRLKFRVSGRVKEPSPLSITNTVDDIKNAATRPGVVFYKEINDKIMRNKNVF